MGAQKEIAQTIVEKGADWLVGLKGNQGLLLDAVERHFNWVFDPKFEHAQPAFHETVEKNGGRIETRKIWVSDASHLPKKFTDEWACLNSIAKVESTREIDGKISVENRYYIGSLDPKNAVLFGKALRSHWSVENQLHWTLDVVFDEDQCRIRQGNAAENMAVVRHIALGLHNQHGRTLEINGKKRTTGLANRRQLASWHKPFLEKLLGLL